MKNLHLLLICSLVLIIELTFAEAIYVSGDVAGVWSADTVFVTGEIRIPPDSSLTIEPGVYIWFNSHYKMIVDSNATLMAIGAETDTIRFHSSAWYAYEIYYGGWHGIRFLNAADESTLKYCQFINGAAYANYGPNEDKNGGGVYCLESNPTISNCLFTNCLADYYGGGIYCQDQSDPHIRNCCFDDNVANVGAAIHCTNSSPLIENNEIINNYAIDGAGIGCDEAAAPIITSNYISDNLAIGSYSSDGGGIWSNWANPEIYSNTIINNVASGSGGGIFVRGFNGVIMDNIIHNNTTINGGGICCGTDSNPIISNNEVIGNSAGNYYGGGIMFYDNSSPIVNNNLFCGNTAYSGGGIWCRDDSYPYIINCVIADNTAEYGSGIYVHSCCPEVFNCVIRNFSTQEIFLDWAASINITYSNIQYGWFGQGNIDEDPLFITGPFSDYHLGPNSPCVDTGNPGPQYDDPEDPQNPGFALWPALGTIRNDMGVYGGDGASGWLGVKEKERTPLPNGFHLYQNFPNPFNPVTTILFELPVATHVTLQVFDVQGRVVATLIDGWRTVGIHEVTFEASGLASGVYLYSMSAGNFEGSGKMILLK
ncbi:hypothetical protein CEE37_14260 [candidate division LCP-89 bacterium B3_LCP]|uniref:Secretion system C-terminal sorting domain-containing protein n=1 Tax=candidate division LCP-89 bacterium B3_LCP TaxID=2012998 RepID=A0A532UQQ1_UNCL8|nr:MAG: hypothetical protein CEE37_14260 [candidate division LCP-89 bacterium B3_LCP]